VILGIREKKVINDHIKGKSPLLNIQIKMVSQFPLDSMHLIHLGVLKRLLLNYFIEGTIPYKFLSKKIIND
jgi:hypothetical protein